MTDTPIVLYRWSEQAHPTRLFALAFGAIMAAIGLVAAVMALLGWVMTALAASFVMVFSVMPVLEHLRNRSSALPEAHLVFDLTTLTVTGAVQAKLQLAAFRWDLRGHCLTLAVAS